GLLPRCEDGGAAAQAAIVVDHTEAARQTKARIGHLGAERLPGDLPDDLDKTEEAAGRAGLAAGELSTGRIEWKRAVRSESVPPHEVRTFAFVAETEILDLHDIDD